MHNEKITVGAGTDYPLKGLLTLPDDLSGPVSAVVMVHGSGASNMDEKVMKLTPFKDLAEGLARHGVASLRYDKRTFAHGFKMIRQKNFTVTVKEETIEDALLAIKMLKNDPRIDCNRIFILGHSMGAMLAPRIDAEGADVKGLIMIAGTPYRLEDIVLRQLKQAGRGRSIMNRIVRMEYRFYRRKFQGLYEMGDEEAKKERAMNSKDNKDRTKKNKVKKDESAKEKEFPAPELSSIMLWSVCPDENSIEWLKLFEVAHFNMAYRQRRIFREIMNQND